jgi:hypothetical protein
VEAGSRFVTAAGYHGTSWDTHSNNDVSTRTVCVRRSIARSPRWWTISRSAGLLETTLVIAMGEFGRTPLINPNLGPRSLAELLVAGASRRRDQPRRCGGCERRQGYNVTDRVVTMGDLFATSIIASASTGRRRIMSPIGRPIKIANSLEDVTGEPVKELLA